MFMSHHDQLLSHCIVYDKVEDEFISMPKGISSIMPRILQYF